MGWHLAEADTCLCHSVARGGSWYDKWEGFPYLHPQSSADSRLRETGGDHPVPHSTNSSSHNSCHSHEVYIRWTLVQMQLQHLHSEHELQIEFQRHRFAFENELVEADAFLNFYCDNESVRSLPTEPANSGIVANSHSISGHFSQARPTDVLCSGLSVVSGGPGTVAHTSSMLTGSVSGPTAISHSVPTPISHRHIPQWPHSRLPWWSHSHLPWWSHSHLPWWSHSHLPRWSHSHLPRWSHSHLPRWSHSHLPWWSHNHLPWWSHSHLPRWSHNHLPRWSHSHLPW